MESQSRKVTIINNKTQSQNVIESSATTLSELKSELNAAGILYAGMTFFEGRSRTELKDDASVLPREVPFRGQVVNDLVFLLSAPQKNIKSGAMSRTEVYMEIKKRNLQEAVQKQFGKNFTMCKTQDLLSLLEKEGKKGKKAETAVPSGSVTQHLKKEKAQPAAKQGKEDNLRGIRIAFSILLEALYEEDILGDEQMESIKSALASPEVQVETGKPATDSGKLSQSEIDEIFNFIH